MQVLKTVSHLDSDAVWLELMTVASCGTAWPLMQNPAPAALPPLKSVLQGSCPSSPAPLSALRAKQALRLLATLPDNAAGWHACIEA